MDLLVAVMTGGDAVIRASGFNLFIFQPAILKTLVFVSVLQSPATPSATIVVGAVRGHINKIFFTHHGFNDKSQIFGNGITVAFSDNLTGILGGKFYFQILVPV